MSFTDFLRKNDEVKITMQVDRETAIRSDLEYIRLNEHNKSSEEQVKEAWLECKRLISEEIVERVFRKYGVTLNDGYWILDYLRTNLNSFVKF